MAEICPALEGRRLTFEIEIDRSVPEAQQLVSNAIAMRTALLALGIVAAGLLAAWILVDRRVELPPVGPSVEQICAEAMRRTPADLSWVAPNRAEKVRGREIFVGLSSR
jgi:hypothetical protein